MIPSQKLRPFVFWSAAAGLLAVIACLGGLFFNQYQGMPAGLTLGSYGQDVAVLLSVGVLAVSVNAARRGSAAGLILWMGLMGFLFYSYATFAFGGVYTRLYPVYLALVGISFYTLVALALQVDAAGLAGRVGRRISAAWVGGLFILVVVLLTPRWAGEIAKLNTGVPFSPYTPIFVLDLGLVFPGMILSTIWLRQGRPWGRVLAGILLVKSVSVGLNLFIADLFLIANSRPVDPFEITFFGSLAVAALAIGWKFFQPGPGSSQQPVDLPQGRQLDRKG